MSTELLFRFVPLDNPADLLYGEVEEAPDREVTIDISLPALSVDIRVARITEVSVVASLPAVTFEVVVQYESGTDRPLVGRVRAKHQDAAALDAAATEGWTRGAPLETGAQAAWADAQALEAPFGARHQDALRHVRPQWVGRHQDAYRLSAVSVAARHQDALRHMRPQRQGRYQDAVPARAGWVGRWQDMLRDRRPSIRVVWSEAGPLHRYFDGAFQDGDPLEVGWQGRWQEAMRPPAGLSRLPIPPGPDPCYLPVVPAHLLFDGAYLPTGALLFVCETHDNETPGPVATVVVPIKGLYMIFNSVVLRRVSDSLLLPALSFSLGIDADSWTWTWSATLPYAALASVDVAGTDPWDVEAEINGVAYRLLVEQIATDRTFGRRDLRISGRGRNATLADPYADRRSFSASGALTAQQIAVDVLTDNGIPIGWGINWGLEDWLVPGGTWSHNGTYITALTAIAQAAGGYLQPHRTDKTIRILHRYPVASWDWAGVTPDFELPSAVTVREAAEWVTKPIYNRVFVAGTRNGRIGRITRSGTAGDAPAPTVVDDLITAVEASRQRGRAVLSDVGRQLPIQLSLPVLNETGVILPGSFVRYIDGSTTRIGLVRTQSLTWSSGSDPRLRQLIGIETHVAS